MTMPGTTSQAMLRFTGDIHQQDSFSLAVVATARYFGREISYDDALALSGNGFAPNFRPEEPCRDSWPLQGGGRNLHLVCARLGLECRPFEIEDPPSGIPAEPVDPAEALAWRIRYHRGPLMRTIQSTIGRGELILSMGEWFGGKGVGWTEWGFPVSVDERGTASRRDGGVFGWASNGRDDNEIDYVRDGWVLRSATQRVLTQDQADREIIRRAIARIRGDVHPMYERDPRNVVYGTKAMDAWIAAMETPFCPEGEADSAPARAARVAMSVVSGARASAAYLRALAPRWAGAADHLLAAAARYDKIVESLDMYAAPDGYRTIINDLPKQREHAATVLAAVSMELAAAGDEMEKGLAAAPRPASCSLPLPDLARYQGARFPEDMPLAGVLGAAMDLLGDDLGLRWDQTQRHGLAVDPTHTFFMGVAGEAFTFNWFPRDGQHPTLDSTLYWPDPATPYRRAMAAAGYGCEVLVCPGLTEEKRGSLDGLKARQRIVECIADKNLPAIVVGVPEPNDFLLVSGYEDDGNTLVGWVSRGGRADVKFDASKRVRTRDWAAGAELVLITGRQDRPSERESVRQALAQAEQLLRLREFGPFHAGPAAFEVWAEALLADAPPPFGWKDEERRTVESRRRFLICPSTWDLMERVSYASFFLHRAASLFPTAAAELQAAETAMSEIGGAMLEACKVSGWEPGRPRPQAEQDRLLADPEVRRKAADAILGCKSKWIAAADHLARALPLMATDRPVAPG